MRRNNESSPMLFSEEAAVTHFSQLGLSLHIYMVWTMFLLILVRMTECYCLSWSTKEMSQVVWCWCLNMLTRISVPTGSAQSSGCQGLLSSSHSFPLDEFPWTLSGISFILDTFSTAYPIILLWDVEFNFWWHFLVTVNTYFSPYECLCMLGLLSIICC